MKVFLSVLCVFVISCLTTGCYYDNEEYLYGACDTSNVTYNGTIKPLLLNNCTGCHNAASAGGGYNLTNYADDASGNKGVRSSALNGSLSGSVNHDGSFSQMPKGGSKLQQCKLDQIRIWVDAGAPNN